MIVIAADSFKGCLSAQDVVDAIAKGAEAGYIASAPKGAGALEIVRLPMSDGGEGMLECLEGSGLKRVGLRVQGPLGREIESFYLMSDGATIQSKVDSMATAAKSAKESVPTAFIEIAKACGLELLAGHERDPKKTTSYGVGEMISHALDSGAERIIVGLGGSSTNDAGIGMLKALGFGFYTHDKKEIEKACGGKLSSIASIDDTLVDRRLRDGSVSIEVACDVNNPLYGPNGAAYIYAGQKGASPSDIEALDAGLESFARVAKRRYGYSATAPGMGAAGGLGYALANFLNARLQNGATLISNALGLERLLSQASLVITGEGSINAQTTMGKLIGSLGALAREYDTPLLALAGSIDEGVDISSLCAAGIASSLCIQQGPISLDEALEPSRAREALAKSTANMTSLLVRMGVEL